MLQVIAFLISLSLIGYILLKAVSKKYKKIDVLLLLPASVALLTVSVYPPIQDKIADLFALENRLFATIIASILLLFIIVVYIINNINLNKRVIGQLIRALAAKEYYENISNKKKGPDILIVIPAYNEEKNIKSVLKTIPKKIDRSTVGVVVVEDGGEDKTYEVVRSVNVPVTSHAINRGQGDSLKTGFEIAIKIGASIVVSMDADGQHKVKDLPTLIRPIVKDKADFVKGSRFLGSHKGTTLSRGIGIKIFSIVLTILTGRRVTDATNGYRAIRVSRLRELELNEKRFSAPELLMEAYNKKLRVLEVPVHIEERISGGSKKPKIFYPIGFLWTIIRTWLR